VNFPAICRNNPAATWETAALNISTKRLITMGCIYVRKQNVLRYQRGNQKPHIEEQTIQWQNEKGQQQNKKQRTTENQRSSL
jgi:hypothetical protein